MGDAGNGDVLPAKWADKWENSKSMAFFGKEDGDVYRFYVLNKETLKLYHVVDFPIKSSEFGPMMNQLGRVYSRGKLYLVGDRHPHDVHVCDLSSTPPYIWTRGPPMRSSKHIPHLVAYNGMIFALSSPDKLNHPSPYNRDGVDPTALMSTFEVWDTNNMIHSWEVLPDPPLKDYNLSAAPGRGTGPGPYEVVSHALFNHIFYFVFDYTRSPPRWIRNKDSTRFCSTIPLCCNKVEAFDPNTKQWVRSYVSDNDTGSDDDSDTEDDADDMLSMFINFSARRHQTFDGLVEFFEGDPSLRMFLFDPTEFLVPPCFYTFDYSTFDSKSILKALRQDHQHTRSHTFLVWFQAFVRPHLSSVTGLSTLMEMLRFRESRGHSCFVLPCSYGHDRWTFCTVAFIRQSNQVLSCVAKFHLEMMTNNRFQAKDLEMRVEQLSNVSTPNIGFFRI